MENNTLISNELEEMRSQIRILKDKLDKQTIINDQHIRKSMKSKMSEINRIILASIIFGALALPYCTWFFWSQEMSILFVVTTAIMLAVCLGLTISKQIILKRLDFSSGNLVEVAQKLGSIKKHYQDWIKIAIPLLIIWFSWFIYEIISNLGVSPMTMGLCTGGLIGGLIGGFIGFRIDRKVIRKTTEILEQIEELQKES